MPTTSFSRSRSAIRRCASSLLPLVGSAIALAAGLLLARGRPTLRVLGVVLAMPLVRYPAWLARMVVLIGSHPR